MTISSHCEIFTKRSDSIKKTITKKKKKKKTELAKDTDRRTIDYRKNSKNGTPEIITMVVLQLEQLDFTVQYCVQKMQTE